MSAEVLRRSDPPAVLAARRLVKRFPHPNGGFVTALAGVDAAIPPNARRTALIGPDGAGKSTFLSLACGIDAPDEGAISVLGRTPNSNDESFSAEIAFMPQSLGLYPNLSVLENLELFESMRGNRRGGEEAAAERRRMLLAATGLERFGSRMSGKLSGGMKQKLALACSLVGMPKLLLLDEPTVGVDPLSRRELWALVNAMVETRGMRCIYSTAYLEEAEAADWVLFLENGRLLDAGPPRDFLAHAAGRTAVLSREGSRLTLSPREMRGFLDEAVRPEGAVLDLVPREGAIEVLAREGRALDPDFARRAGGRLEPRAPRFEDAYAALALDAKGALREPARERAPDPTRERRILIRAEAISKRFGDFVAVADTTFDVAEGEIFGLLGPNGAGKTTTFRMLCGLLPPSSGRIEIEGLDLRKALSRVRGKFGYVAQRFSLYGKLTVEENLRYFAGSYGLSGRRRREVVEAALDEYGLAAHRSSFAGSLSEGAKRDLAIACALLHRPRILFLDEATSGADLASRRALWRRVAHLAAGGTSVVVTTHFLDEAEYCDRFLIQDAGRILALGTPEEVRAAARRLLPEAEREGVRSIEDAFIAIVEDKRRAGPKEGS